jgi:hypothetical protein
MRGIQFDKRMGRIEGEAVLSKTAEDLIISCEDKDIRWQWACLYKHTVWKRRSLGWHFGVLLSTLLYEM